MLYDLGPRARHVHALLLDRLRSGQLAPGVRLPPHTVLAQTFDVAPLTMRQVLARLEADGYLRRERGRGTFVRSARPAAVLVAAADAERRMAALEVVQRTGHDALVAATSADALAAISREPGLQLVVLDLDLPTAAAGLRVARLARQRRPNLTIAVLAPTRRQQTRLDHSVAPPLIVLD